MTLNRTLSYAAGTMISVLTIVAAADAKPFSHGHAGGTDQTSAKSLTQRHLSNVISQAQAPAWYLSIRSLDT